MPGATDNLTREEWPVVIGVVTKPQGLLGELRVRPHTDRLERFGELEQVGMFPPRGEPRICAITEWRSYSGWIYLRVEGISDREGAETLRDAEVRIRKDMRYELEEGEYWVEDLIGIEVTTDTGVALGTIHDVLQYPANDVYVTEHCLIPAIADILLEVDVAGKKMTVRAMPGLAPDLGI